MEIERVPRLTVSIVKVDNGFAVDVIDPTPLLKAAQKISASNGPQIKNEEDIDRSIEAMIAFNRHMGNQIEGESWQNDDSKRQLLREGFRLHFPQFFQQQAPNVQFGLIVPQSFVFNKMDDLLKFIKAKL